MCEKTGVPCGQGGCLWEPHPHIQDPSIDLGPGTQFLDYIPYLGSPGQTTASVSLLIVSEVVILQCPLVTRHRLAFLLPWQFQFPRLPLGPQEELDASAAFRLGQRIRTPGFQSTIPHHLRMEGHKFSLPPWIIRIITATIMVMNK